MAKSNNPFIILTIVSENQNFNVIKWAHLRIEHVHCTEKVAN